MQSPALIILGVAVAVLLAVWWLRRRRRARRRRLMAQPLPPGWEAIIERNVGVYRRLPDELRARLGGLINVFLDEKNFEGCGGLELTDEMRLTVAAQACLLIVNRPGRIYPRLSSVLVYPEAYVVERSVRMGSTAIRASEVLAGESWTNAAVVLAWDHAAHGAADFRDGQNVVLHEFAHQIDQENNLGDGLPSFDTREEFEDWARVVSAAFKRHRRDVAQNRRRFLDDYAATNAAEFFAVATETFFEDPERMQLHEPDLYQQLKRFYRLDPGEW